MSPWPFRKILLLFVASRLALWALATFTLEVVPDGRWPLLDKYGDLNDPRVLFLRWDATWYRMIAEGGYSYEPGVESTVAFFPAYPLLARFASRLTAGDVTTAGYLVSNLCLLGACAYLSRLMASDGHRPEAGRDVCALVLLGPVSFFFSIFFTESLFLFLTVGTAYYARNRAWGKAALFAAFASATKVLGVLTALLLVLELGGALRRREARPAHLLWLLLAPAGLVGYCAYLAIRFGEPFVFVTAASAWGRHLSSPLTALATIRSYPQYHQVLFTLCLSLAAAAVAQLFRTGARRADAVYALVFLVANLSTSSLMAIPRHLSGIFPLYAAFGAWALEHERGRWAFFGVSTVLLLVNTVLFVNGHWMP